MDWAEFILAGLVFMASHAVPSQPRLKGALVAALGRRGYGMAFGLLSTALLFWVIFAAARAPYVELWPQAGWMRWLVNLTMPLVILLGSLGIGAPNPFAFEGRESGFAPKAPGIAGFTRQSLLWALALWSAVHLIANGDVAHAILFGTFLIFSLVGMRAMEARLARTWGQAEFDRRAAHTSLIPGAAWLTGRWKPKGGPSLTRLGIALVSWAVLWHLHAPVIGLSPAP